MTETQPDLPPPAAAAAAGDARAPTVIEALVRSLGDLSDNMLGGRLAVSPPEWRDAADAADDDQAGRGHGPAGRPAAAGLSVACAIAFTGELSGAVTVRFEPAAAEWVAKAFTGVPLTCRSPDFADAVGEIANMVVGAAKARLPHEARISTPAVSFSAGPADPGKGPAANAGGMVIPCRTPAGWFEVAVGVRDARPAGRRAA